jgi:predicted PurR-regulated permease PerM
VITAVLRQLIGPKILGKSLNLHPLVSLGAIYLGYAIFGFMGLFILPLVAVAVSAVLKKDSAAEIG